MPRNSKDNSLARYREMEDITRQYFAALKVQKPLITTSSKKKLIYKESTKYVKKFKKTFSLLDKELQEFINYSFIEKESINWLKAQYSNATFYRKRDKAITTFVNEFKL